jgi:hypothetical protein
VKRFSCQPNVTGTVFDQKNLYRHFCFSSDSS